MPLMDDEVLVKGMRKIWLIWGAILFSLVIYVLVCYLLDAQGWTPQAADDFPLSTVKLALYLISPLILVGSHFLRKFLMKQQSESVEAGYVQTAANTNSDPAIVKYTVVVLVSAALSESVGIFGLVLYLLAKDHQALFNFIVIAAVALVYHRPKMEELQMLVSSMPQASATGRLQPDGRRQGM